MRASRRHQAVLGTVGDFSDAEGCEAQFRSAFVQGCVGAWSLHPDQIEIAKRVFSPDPAEVAFAKRILEAMPDGSGAVMIDGKMQDDATWRQAKVMVDRARCRRKGSCARKGLSVLKSHLPYLPVRWEHLKIVVVL